MIENYIDIYYYEEDGQLLLQGATQQGIDHLRGRYRLHHGTIALLPETEAEEGFDAIDAAQLQARTL